MDNSPLYILPPELRTMIYEFALISSTHILVTSDSWAPATSWKAPALLQTCRQIAAEATSIYYACNTFYARDTLWNHSAVVMGIWLKSLCEAKRSCIRRVCVKRDGLSEDVADCRKVMHQMEVPMEQAEVIIES